MTYDDMTYNPFDVQEGQFIWERYPVFGRRQILSTLPDHDGYKSWSLIDLDKLVRVMVLFVDPESPLAGETDFDFRKKESIRLVKPTAKVVKEIEEEGPIFQAVVYELFKLANSYQYEAWWSMKMNFHIMNREMRRPPKTFDASTLNARRMLSAGMDEQLLAIAKMESALFSDKRIEKLINDAAMADDIGGWVEEFAEDAEWKVQEEE